MKTDEVLELYSEYKNTVFRLAVSYLKNTNDAEDAVQTVFLKLLDDKIVVCEGKERAFIMQITANHCKNVLKSVWKKRIEPLYDNLIFEQKDKELFYAVMELKEKYRVAIYLHYYEGYTFGEIAELLGISESAVSMRLHRAKKILKLKLEVTI